MTVQGIKGQTDKKHYNKWEDWLPVAFDASDFSPFNTLWLSFFVCSEAIGPEVHNEVLKRVMQSVYTSLPELSGILFLLRTSPYLIFNRWGGEPGGRGVHFPAAGGEL